MNKEDLMLAFEEKAEELKMCLDQKWGDYENPYTNSDTSLAYDLFKSGAQAQLAQYQSDDYVLVPRNPTVEMWSELPRMLGRYMQSHDRYCPKTLKKYINRFAGETPEWMNKEVVSWESDHAFATADLPVFIYKAIVLLLCFDHGFVNKYR